jgi:hypothetical protein
MGLPVKIRREGGHKPGGEPVELSVVGDYATAA